MPFLRLRKREISLTNSESRSRETRLSFKFVLNTPHVRKSVYVRYDATDQLYKHHGYVYFPVVIFINSRVHLTSPMWRDRTAIYYLAIIVLMNYQNISKRKELTLLDVHTLTTYIYD